MGRENNKNNDGFDLGNIGILLLVGGFLLGIICMLLAGFILGNNEVVMRASMIIPIFIMIIGAVLMLIYHEDEKSAHISNMNTFQEEYDQYAKKLGVVKSDTQVTLIEQKYSFKISHYMWVADGCINIFPMAKYYIYNETSSGSRPDVSKLHITSIPLDFILYFEEMGELRKYATVSGGGTSLKGALVGYALADDLGAIIGSREPIKTTVVSEDDRRVELIYKNKEGDIKNLEFTHDAYKVFKNLIPSKELRRMTNLKKAKNGKEASDKEVQKSPTAKDKLKQLKEMNKEGLITEDEFLEQKRKILDSF